MITLRRSRLARLALVAAGALALGACDLLEPPKPYAAGHVDAPGVAYEDGAIALHVHDEEGGVELEPHEAVLQAVPASETTVPSDPAFSFLGDPGDPVWVLPEVQDPELLWLGYAAEEVETGVFEDDELTWQLVEVDGPGDVFLFTVDPFGTPDVLFDSKNGLPDSTAIGVGEHHHASWAFTAPGHYEVTYVVGGTLVGGGPVDSGPVQFTFVVGEYECGDVDDVTITPSPARVGRPVEVAYTLENCGTQTSDVGASVTVRAPVSCGGGSTTVTGSTRTLDAGETATDSVTFNAPSCRGTYTVKVKADEVPYRYAEQRSLKVRR